MRRPKSQRTTFHKTGIKTTSNARDRNGLTEMQRDALRSLDGMRKAGRHGSATSCRVKRSVMQALVTKGYATETDQDGKVVMETMYDITDNGIAVAADPKE